MKIQQLSFVIALMSFAACQPPQPATESVASDDAVASEAPDYVDFDKKVDVIRAFIQSHCDEDLEAQTALLADTLNWSPPYYNSNEWLGKEDYTAALQNYHNDYENIQFNEGIVMPDSMVNGMWSGSVFPQETATITPNVIRIYGTWSATHTASGKEVGVKWFALGSLNDAGEIAQFSEYFDAHGLAAQIAAE